MISLSYILSRVFAVDSIGANRPYFMLNLLFVISQDRAIVSKRLIYKSLNVSV